MVVKAKIKNKSCGNAYEMNGISKSHTHHNFLYHHFSFFSFISVAIKMLKKIFRTEIITVDWPFILTN